MSWHFVLNVYIGVPRAVTCARQTLNLPNMCTALVETTSTQITPETSLASLAQVASQFAATFRNRLNTGTIVIVFFLINATFVTIPMYCSFAEVPAVRTIASCFDAMPLYLVVVADVITADIIRPKADDVIVVGGGYGIVVIR